MAKYKDKKKDKENFNADLNNDGVVDSKDKSIAAKVLATKTENLDSPSTDAGDKVLAKDLNLTYRKGDTLPAKEYQRLKGMGLDIDNYI